MTARRIALFAAVFLTCVGCDQATKTVAESTLSGSPSISFLGDFVRFELASNPGAFLSLGAGLPESVRRLIFQAVVPLTLVALCVLAGRSGASALALGLIAGGGLGNWIDRIAQSGAVTDFVSLGAGPLRTGIFNLADVFIIAGVALTMFSMERDKPETEQPDGPGPA
ncbi:MAG: signal peptidase II [Myxococcales bacterium]|nr:signal peptidase II [Myxococcales bacterium]